ncbi:O-methyltransferase [Phaeospirillum tilakii]|uniref:O-methyltransferase n=1 Tax=Phaeospirillum tilakii TaxID=741673 RepID=A0ABW5C6D5_9PROT
MGFEEIDALCRHIDQEIERQRPAVGERIEAIYRAYNRDFGIDWNDQSYFLTFLYLATRFRAPHSIIQTGTCCGHSAIAMALGLEDGGIDGTIDTIDPEPQAYGDGAVTRPVEIARQVARQSGHHHRIRFHRGYSVRAWDAGRIDLVNAPEGVLEQLAVPRSADLVVVDGDHTFPGAYWDLEYGARCLRPGGARLMITHDFKSIPTVRDAVRRWVRQRPGDVTLRVWGQYNGYALIGVAVP